MRWADIMSPEKGQHVRGGYGSPPERETNG